MLVRSTLVAVVLVFGLFLGAAFPVRADVLIDVTELPLPVGFSDAWATAISDSPGAKIVGYGWGPATGGHGHPHALLWPDIFTVIDLHPTGPIPCATYQQHNADPSVTFFCADADFSFAYGIDGDQISGSASVFVHNSTLTWQTSWPMALLWTYGLPTWSVVSLHPPYPVEYSAGAGAGGGKQVGSAQFVDTNDRAFLWSGTNQSAVNLGPLGLPPGDKSFGVATDGNQQVGYVYGSIFPSAHAALWAGTPESYVDLHPADCVRGSRATGVRDGQQVGWCFDANGAPHALIWHGTPESVIDLGFGTIMGTNGQKQVGTGPRAPLGAALWYGTADSLTDIRASTFMFSAALAINNLGYIVGIGIDSASHNHPLHWFVSVGPAPTPLPSPTPTALPTPSVSPTPVGAAGRKCRRAVVTGAAALVQSEAKALRTCAGKVVTGKLPRGTACGTEATTAAAIGKAQATFADIVAKACGGKDRACGAGSDDVSLADAGWQMGSCPGIEGGTCTNAIVDCNGIATCVTCTSEAALNQAIGLYYDGLIPTDSKDKNQKTLNKCQATVGSAGTTFLIAKSNATAKCWEAVNADKATGACPAADGKAVDAIAQAESKKIAAICKVCGGTDKACGGTADLTPLQIGFASSCPDVSVPGSASCAATIATLQDLVTCVDCVTEFVVDCATLAAVPTFATYPPECTP